MNEHRYKIRFVGGPSGGAVVAATHFAPDEKLWMPASAASVEPLSERRRRSRVHCRSVYRLSGTHHTVEDSHPTIHYEYEFAGLESLKGDCETQSSATAQHPWLHRIIGLVWPWRARNLWLPLPEGRPQRLAQVAALNAASAGGSSLAG